MTSHVERIRTLTNLVQAGMIELDDLSPTIRRAVANALKLRETPEQRRDADLRKAGHTCVDGKTCRLCLW